jgi:transposase
MRGEILGMERRRFWRDEDKLNGLNPLAYLADILDRIHDHKINRLDELLPWNWSPMASAMNNQAA